MGKPTLREQYREDPRVTMFSLAGALAAYAALGAARPRWLTAYARHPVRNAVLATAWRFSVRSMYFLKVRPWVERNKRAHAELRDELGREPTPEEQIARMELLADRS